MGTKAIEAANALITEYKSKGQAIYEVRVKYGTYVGYDEEDRKINGENVDELIEKSLLKASGLREELRRNMGEESRAIKEALPASASEPIIELIEARYSETITNLRDIMETMVNDWDWVQIYELEKEPRPTYRQWILKREEHCANLKRRYLPDSK